MEAWQAVTLFILFALVVGGGVFYLVIGPERLRETLSEAWENHRERHAERRAQTQVLEAARRREREVGVEVGLSPAAVLDRAVEAMTRGGYGLESRSENTVTFARHEGADSCAGCILMLLFLLPGILYLLLAQRTIRVTFAAYPIEGGCRLVVGGDHPQAVMQAVEWARTLPRPGSQSEVEESFSENAAQADPTTVEDRRPADTLRELAELRDQGLVTQEEYEAKKRDLLDRM